MPNPPGGYQPDTKSESARRADFDLLRRIVQLEQRVIELVEPVPPQAWTNLTLLNGWIVETAGVALPAYRRIDDLVYIRGSATFVGAHPINLPIAVLPVGFRPPAVIRAACGAHKANAGGAFVIRTTVQADGSIFISEYSAADQANPVIALSDISPFSVTP